MNVIEIKAIEKRLADLEKLKGLTIENLPDYYKADVRTLLKVLQSMRLTVARLCQVRDAKEGVIPLPEQSYYHSIDQGISKLLRGEFKDPAKPPVN